MRKRGGAREAQELRGARVTGQPRDVGFDALRRSRDACRCGTVVTAEGARAHLRATGGTAGAGQRYEGEDRS